MTSKANASEWSRRSHDVPDSARPIAEVERLLSQASFAGVATLCPPMGTGLMAWTSANRP